MGKGLKNIDDDGNDDADNDDTSWYFDLYFFVFYFCFFLAGPPKPSKPIKTILIVIGLITAFILAGCGFLYKCYLMQRARWQESTSVLDVHEYSTPRVRHRFPGMNHPRNANNVGTQTLMNGEFCMWCVCV